MKPLKAWLTREFADEWRCVHKFLTSWLAVIGGLLSLILLNAPTAILTALNSLPPEVRAQISPVVFVVVTMIPVVLSLREKAKQAKKNDEQ